VLITAAGVFAESFWYMKKEMDKDSNKALKLYYGYNDKVFKWCYSESQKK
jgi:hypothetical protein